MTVRPFAPRRIKLAPLTLSLLLAACGGDGGGDAATPPPNAGNPPVTNPPPAASTTIAGVAAAGLPLVGTVTVKDAQGATRSATIGSNGSYSIDVSGMTAPFVFRAEGRAGGREYVLHSAATTADVGNTLNVTPLTDLVVSNIAGEVAQRYFDNATNLSGLTAEALAAEQAQLRQRLLPVLQALGVDAAVDLLRTPFTPLASALDRAIDVLRVDYNAGAATITNVVTQQQISDNLATRAAQEAAAPALTETVGVAQAGSDIDQIRAALNAFAALYATGIPAPGAVLPNLTSDFQDRDQDAEAFLAELSSLAAVVGAQFTEVTIKRIDYANPARPIADVSFVIRSAGGNLLAHVRNWKLAKDGASWRLHGDQRRLDVEVIAFMNRLTSAAQGAQPRTCNLSGLTLLVEDHDGAVDDDGDTAYVMASGPGLPAGGIRLTKPDTGGYFTIDQSASNGGQGNYYVVADSCRNGGFGMAGTADIPANATYTLTAYTAAGAPVAGMVYTDEVRQRPLTLAEVQASTQFPVIAAPTFAQLAGYNGGSLAITAGNFDPTGFAFFELGASYSTGDFLSADNELPVPSSGSLSVNLSVPAATGGAVMSFRVLQVENLTAGGREFATRYVISPAQ